MSCQQALRHLTTNSNAKINSKCKNLNNNQNHIIIKGNHATKGVIQQEDPYVFTESVPTTPPVLFSAQKTRTRLNDLTSATNIEKLQQQNLPLTETNGKITSTSNQIKTQASFLSAAATTNSSTTTTPTSRSNVTHSITGAATLISKKLTNVCVVRPQLQTQQSHYHHYQQQQQQQQHQQQQQQLHQNYINSLNEYDGDLKSISPPPLYTLPTPSLWQTPLLLESTTSTSGSASSKVVNVSARKTLTGTSQTVPIMGCVTTTVQTVGSTTTTMNHSLTTTAMAKVAPIVHATLVPPPLPSAQSSNQCLPPSKFHNHTLAQHLQKVECLKKSKKLTEVETNFCSDNATSLTDNADSSVKHSENEELSDIPVNVIFRSAGVPQANDESSNNKQFVNPQTECNPQAQPQSSSSPPSSPAPSPPQPKKSVPPPSLPATTHLKVNENTKMSKPALKTNVAKPIVKLQQINTSSILQQQCNATKTTTTITTTALNCHQTPKEEKDNDRKTPTNIEAATKIIANSIGNTKIIVANQKRKNPTPITNKIRKLNNSFPAANHNFDSSEPNWQIDCTTTKGAVAIVKISQRNIDLDTTHLATTTGLPYCLQQYWLNSYDVCKYSAELRINNPNRSLAREERIAVHKQQLRRKAMQLLSIRSLQKLPLQLAKRRLLCVDRLLRKYQQNDENKRKLPANIKRCCVNGCDAYTLEMASHCQQHIVYNAAQHLFLPCTAKFADNTQCRVPVFDITHDLPLCMEHARKRDAYNRHLYEQRPRKISTNPILLNETIKISAKNTQVGVVTAGEVAIKTQNYQPQLQQPQYQQHQNKQQQQQHQQKQQKEHKHILQQLPINNNNNIKEILVNPHARKRKMAAGLTTNSVGRPQKRVKKSVEKSVGTSATETMAKHQMPRLTSTSFKRKSSTTSLESIASNSQHSATSSTSQLPQQHLYSVPPAISNAATMSLAPPALAPLSSGLVGHGLPQHLFSFGHDTHTQQQQPQNRTQYNHNHHQQLQHQQPQFHPININGKHSASVCSNSATKASTPTELKDFISQFSLLSQKHTQAEGITADVSLLNTNSNSNFTSSGMGSTTSLPTADDFLTQDMLSICENSSASSVDTGLGGLSDPELMLGGAEDDIPLGDTHLLEEHDLENVLNSLPEDAFKELFTTVHQDESDEIERAIELADKHLKTLQQTIGSELGDFLDFSDEMLMDNGGLCNGSAVNTVLDTSALFIGGGNAASTATAAGAATVTATVAANASQGGGAVIGTDIRGLVQT